MKPIISIILLLVGERAVYAINDGLPIKLKPDMERFKSLTTGDGNNAVIMGRKTWESLPEKYRPLPDRLNIVITSQDDYQVPSGVIVCKNLRSAISVAGGNCCDEIFVIGGKKLWLEAFKSEILDKIYLTHIMRTARKNPAQEESVCSELKPHKLTKKFQLKELQIFTPTDKRPPHGFYFYKRK